MFGDTVSEIQKYDTVPLDEVFDKPQGGEWGTDDDAGTGTPVLRTTNFTDGGYVDYSDVATRIIDAKKVEKKALLSGDILIEKSGGSNDKPVGRVVFFEGESGKYLNNNFTARLHLNGRYNLGKLYTFFFMFVNYWADGTRLYEGKTTGIHNLHLTEYLQNTRIPLAPVDAQERFEQFARQSDKSKFDCSNRNLSRCSEIRITMQIQFRLKQHLLFVMILENRLTIRFAQKCTKMQCIRTTVQMVR